MGKRTPASDSSQLAEVARILICSLNSLSLSAETHQPSTAPHLCRDSEDALLYHFSKNSDACCLVAAPSASARAQQEAGLYIADRNRARDL